MEVTPAGKLFLQSLVRLNYSQYILGMSRIDEYSNTKRFLPLTEFEKKNRIFGKIAAHLCVPLTSLFRHI